MPKISQTILDATFYLYQSEEDAKVGRSVGGTGFLVKYWPPGGSAANWYSPHIYAVTNWHVACCGSSVIRLNRFGTVGDKTEVFPFDPSEWTFIKGGDDVAVIRIPADRASLQFVAVDTHLLLRKPLDKRGDIGPGDDVFMVGRFMDHDGGVTNQPAVRFGHISMSPTSIRLDELGRERDYYCVDLHSRTGFSGSPVFVYRTIGQDLSGDDVATLIRKFRERNGRDLPWWDLRPFFGLLGIHCAQFPERWELKSTGKHGRRRKPREQYVIGMSGMTMVAPSWAILETLEHPALKKEREYFDAAADKPPEVDGPVLESDAPSSSPVPMPRAPRKRARKR